MSEHWSKDHLPALTIPQPCCAHCHSEVRIEDGTARCEECLVEWARVDEDAEATPDTGLVDPEARCQSMDYPARASIEHKPCILPIGHDSAHRFPWRPRLAPMA